MNRYFSPQVESLEERMVMDAAGTHVIYQDLVVPTSEVAIVADASTASHSDNDWRYVPVRRISLAEEPASSDATGGGGVDVIFAGLGQDRMGRPAISVTLIPPIPRTAASSDLFAQDATAADDVWVDGKIITSDTAMAGHSLSADWYWLVSTSASEAIGGGGSDVIFGGLGQDDLASATSLQTHPGGANFLFGDGSVRFVSDGISSNSSVGFGSLVDDTDTASQRLPVLMVIANQDFVEPDPNSLVAPADALPSSLGGGRGMGKVILQDYPT